MSRKQFIGRVPIGSSRRIVLPILERLDREAITSQQGELRA
jgi:hypothetical protein